MVNLQEKQWWAPVWKGLVMDANGKHYRKMKNAVWLFLYLVVNARRGTGILMRKTKTISADMGLPRDTIIRWLNTLRKEGYIATLSTGRYLTIQVKNWRPVVKHGQIQPLLPGISDTRSWKYPTPSWPANRPIPVHSGPKSGVSPPPNKKKINKLLNNETPATGPTTRHHADDRAFTAIGSCARQELLAWKLANALDDLAGIDLYRSYCREYSEELVRKVLSEVGRVSATRPGKGRVELFNHLLQHYAQGTTTNPGD